MAEAAIKEKPAAAEERELTDGFNLIIDALKLNGLTTIYGVPGIPITDFGRMAQAAGIRVLSFRHEQNAGYAASIAGFLTKKPGVCLTVSAPGFLNGLTALAHATAGRKVYAAVLNAGVTHFGGYHELSWRDFEAMLQTNVIGIVRMTTAILPHLEKNSPGGGIMLVSSMAGITPLPYQAAYSGTKAFIISFGCAMSHELHDKDLSITIYAPGGVATEMTAGEKFNALRRWLMPVDAAARDGVDAFRRRKYVHVPGVTNKLGAVLWRVLPQRMVTSQVAASYRRALELAKKA